MVYITQLVYVKPGMESGFNDFEKSVIPLLKEHGGVVELRIRPEKGSFMQGALALPYEIHLLRFDEEQNLAEYLKDQRRRAWLHLKEKSVEQLISIKGQTLN